MRWNCHYQVLLLKKNAGSQNFQGFWTFWIYLWSELHLTLVYFSPDQNKICIHAPKLIVIRILYGYGFSDGYDVFLQP